MHQQHLRWQSVHCGATGSLTQAKLSQNDPGRTLSLQLQLLLKLPRCLHHFHCWMVLGLPQMAFCVTLSFRSQWGYLGDTACPRCPGALSPEAPVPP
jgi:hypothetical protein